MPEIARSPYDLVFLNLHLRGEGSFCQEGDELGEVRPPVGGSAISG